MVDKAYFEKENFVKEDIFIGAEDKPANAPDAFHICFNIDKKYFRQMGVMVTSILKNNKDKNFVFHTFIDEYPSEEKARMQKLAQEFKQEFWFHVLDTDKFSDFPNVRDEMSYVAYFRIYMPKVMKNFTGRYLYTDVDMLCLGSLDYFEKLDFKNHPVAVVEDLPQTAGPQLKILKMKNNRYFNSGMMYVNIEEWEKRAITEKCFTTLWQAKEPFFYLDQDVLNLAIDGDVVFLPSRYNYLPDISRELWETEVNEPAGLVIYHFIGGRKPWDFCLGDYDRLWRSYCAQSLWDCPVDPILAREPKNYQKYRHAAKYFFHKGNFYETAKCLWLYASLKIKRYGN